MRNTDLHKGTRSGFTLMELMIAAVILAVALAGLLGAFIANFNLIESGKNLTAAISHARIVMEEVRDYNIPSLITAEEWTDWAQLESPDGGGCNSLGNETVVVTYPLGTAANPLEVLVTVNWTEKGRARSVQLVTLITER